MPKILEVNGYKFYIYTNDHLPSHVHVIKGSGETKIMLEPEILIHSNYGLKSKELKKVLELVVEHYDFIIDKWNETHN